MVRIHSLSNMLNNSLILDEQWLSVEQQGVNKNQAAKVAQVRQTITNEMWEDYRKS